MKSQFANDIKLVKERCELFATHRGKSVRMKLESCEGKTVDYTTFADDDINGDCYCYGWSMCGNGSAISFNNGWKWRCCEVFCR